MKLIYRAGLLTSFLFLAACSSTPQHQSNIQLSDPRDPWQALNRKTHRFNTVLDEQLLVPVVNIYRDVTPDIVEKGVTNFFSNLGGVRNLVNHSLQLKFKRVTKDIGRLVVNTTLGLGGLIDVASDLGIYQKPADFGQTLGYWGVNSGPYIVLPFLGPSTVRDAGATLIDTNLSLSPIGEYDPPAHRFVLNSLQTIDSRSQLGNIQTLISGDPYVFVREVYLQRRKYFIGDRVASEDDDFDDF